MMHGCDIGGAVLHMGMALQDVAANDNGNHLFGLHENNSLHSGPYIIQSTTPFQ